MLIRGPADMIFPFLDEYMTVSSCESKTILLVIKHDPFNEALVSSCGNWPPPAHYFISHNGKDWEQTSGSTLVPRVAQQQVRNY